MANQNHLMANPNWQTKFRDLPEIPKVKQWQKGKDSTLEQDVSIKILTYQPIDKSEEETLAELTKFYFDLNEKLKSLDYSNFTEEDFENFKNYIFYVYNYVSLSVENITIIRTYRLVVNESVSGKNERIDSISFLKYPSLGIVKKINKYNRANTPLTNCFYSSENIDTTLKEARPPLNKLVTVGLWKPKHNRKFTNYPLSHSEVAAKVNEGLAKATKSIDKFGNYPSDLIQNLFKFYASILGQEYTKIVNHHYEYLISSIFSEKIFAKHNLNTPEGLKPFEYDCILYPSVGNGYITNNIALRPSVLDSEFYLEKAIEFEIVEQFYDKVYELKHPEEITLAKVKNVAVSSKIDMEGGKIIW